MNLRNAVVLLFVMVAGAGCRSREPEASEALAITGDDDRVEAHDLAPGSPLAKAAAATGLLLDAATLSTPSGETRTLQTSGNLIDAGFCADERFASQKVVPQACSAFLVAPDVVVTAGHCLQLGPCAKLAFVFGFREGKPGASAAKVANQDVYRCGEVLAQESASGRRDYAVLRLDRDVTGHAPLAVRREGEMPEGTKLAIAGHPYGLPLKAAGGGVATLHRVKPFGQPLTVVQEVFRTGLDAMAGNSGSPVIDSATGLVEGVFVYGAHDEAADANCVRWRVCADDCVPELAVRTTVFSAAVP